MPVFEAPYAGRVAGVKNYLAGEANFVKLRMVGADYAHDQAPSVAGKACSYRM